MDSFREHTKAIKLLEERDSRLTSIYRGNASSIDKGLFNNPINVISHADNNTQNIEGSDTNKRSLDVESCDDSNKRIKNEKHSLDFIINNKNQDNVANSDDFPGKSILDDGYERSLASIHEEEIMEAIGFLLIVPIVIGMSLYLL